MNRRTALKNCFIFSAGVALIPACMQENKNSIPLKNISVSASYQDMLAELCESIIVNTN